MQLAFHHFHNYACSTSMLYHNTVRNRLPRTSIDSSHLFAVSQAVGIRTTQCGVISDVSMSDGDEWDSTLSVMLSDSGLQK
jgi:hypothetical protein